MVPVRKDPEALPACHDKVDIHPKGFIRFDLELFKLLERLTTNVTQKFLIFWRSEFRDPMVLPSRNWRPKFLSDQKSGGSSTQVTLKPSQPGKE
jgi:hypothetical protein